jgi:tetratricopeptide (TPR) repeat protein/DNA-binding winged helix-turn-helix (wHTH) protein
VEGSAISRVAGSGQAALDGRPIYRFEDIEVDASRGCLKRQGREEHLRQQSFHLLLYLLEHRETVVGKEELIEQFWQGAAVTDNTIVQCIKEIRKALGDHPREPRFIRTIHRIGYRFIAPVEEERATIAETPSKIEFYSTPVPERATFFANTLRWLQRAKSNRILPVAAIVAVIAFAGWMMMRGHAGPVHVDVMLPHVDGRKALAVMYFENQSARPDLHWLSEGLADMFISDLAHFDRLTVLSRQQLHLLLERAGYRSDKGVRLDQALSIARKSHADAVLLGSFVSLGDKLLINVRLFDASASQLLVADQFLVDQPSDILTQVDLLSPKLASRLGIAAPAKQTSLAEVMTNNLEAYRYYSLGVSKAQSFQNAQATVLLKKAIQLDPTFAMAYARIGYAYAVTDFLPEKGRQFLEKALKSSGNLTEKDRLYISAWYAISRQDYPSAISLLQQIIQRYPLEIEAYTRLGRLLHREERPQETISVVQRGLAIDPESGDLYNVIGVCFLALGRYEEAIRAHKHYVELAPNEPNAHDSLGMSLQQSGRFDEAIAEYNAALSQDPEFEPAIIHLGDVFFQQGRYEEAVRQYQRYIKVTGSDTARAIGYGSIAQVYLRGRKFAKAAEAVDSEMRYEPGAVWNSLLLALSRNDQEKAAKLKAEFTKVLVQSGPYPARGSRTERRSYDYYLGTLALHERHPAEAVDHFRKALGHLPPSSGLDLYEDCLGKAYLELGRWDDAIQEFQRILHLNPNYPLAEYHIAQAYQQRGRIDQARTAYERFLQIWKGADPDIAEIVDAKRMLEKSSAIANAVSSIAK